MAETPQDGQRCVICHARAKRGYIPHTQECPQFKGQAQHLGQPQADVAARYDLFVSKLQPNPRHRDRYTCPSCGDEKHGGLKVDPGRDGPMFYCFGCRGDTEIVEAAGLSWSDIRPPRERPRPEPENPDPSPEPPGARTLADTLATFRRWLYLKDPEPLYALAAALVANRAPGDPVWLLLVCAPSTGKTELLSAATRLPWVRSASTITASSLLSGTSKRERAKDATGGLLRQIGEFGVILAKDFTSLLAQNKDTRAEALAALREVYDGRWDRAVGTDGGRMLTWKGKAGLVGGVTPALDRYHAVVSTLGDRFLLLRMPDPDPAVTGRMAMTHRGREAQMRAELADALGGLVEHTDPAPVDRPLSDHEQDRLIRLATFTARARTGVERDGYTHELLYLPQVEGPGRLVLAYARLFGGLEAIGCHPDTAWSVVTRVAVDCAPAARATLLRVLLAADQPLTTSAVAESVGMVKSSAERLLEDASLLGMADRTRAGQAANAANLWQPSPWLVEHWPAHRAGAPSKSTPLPPTPTEGGYSDVETERDPTRPPVLVEGAHHFPIFDRISQEAP